MLQRIDDICLYTGDMGDQQVAADCAAAKAWLIANGITFADMWYGDPAQHEDCMSPLRGWFPGETITAFPFVIYTEVHDDLPPSQFPRFLIYGRAAIEASNLADLFLLGR
jgi:hypothetical protein